MSTQTYHWPEIRDELITLFNGELPHAETENDIIEAFKERPRTVISTADSIANGLPPRSYWAVLRSRVQTAGHVGADITATDERERDRKIVNARRWIHNAGVHFDRESDVIDELFNAQGILRDHDTSELRNEMAEAWRQERPRGERAEAESLAYAAKVKADRLRLELMRKERLAELDKLQEEGKG